MSPMLSLRPATTADYPFMQTLHRQCFLDYAQQAFGWDQAKLDEEFQLELAGANRQIALLDQQPIGSLVILDYRDHIYLEYVAILPACQRLGLGTQLIQIAQSEAARRRIPLRLSVLKVNPARSLYERLGFRTTNSAPDRWFMQYNPG